MTLFQSFILGITQGITELLPISSSAHLVLIPHIFGWESQSTSFDIILHAGTLFALIVYFKKELILLITKFKQQSNQKLLINLIITTIPASVIGLLCNDFIEQNLKSLQVIVIMMITIGLIFLFTDKIIKSNNKNISQLSYKNSLIIGCTQILSFIRGTSRSGIMMIGGIVNGLSLDQSAKYAFLAGIPIIAGASIYQSIEFISEGFGNLELINIAIGFASAFISSLLAIKFTLSFLKNRGLAVFGIYRIIVGILILIILL